jgi:muramoyltetrapeptide carboxypeptidase
MAIVALPMDIPTFRPPCLHDGDTIGIIAPAGPVSRRDDFERGVAVLNRMGFNTRYDERIFDNRRYLAGNDTSRAEELMRYFEDPSVQAILPLRGGYGCARLLPYLDRKRLCRHPKLLTGFSDLTTLHLYFQRLFGWATIYGPMVTSPSLCEISGRAEEHLKSLWTDPNYLPEITFPQMESLTPGVAEGRLTGGCLSVVVTSLGTPYEIQTDGAILFLEDLSEPPYRLDRMISHLKLAGKLDHINGLLLGSFIDCEPDNASDYTARDVILDVVGDLQVPVLYNFPAGHGREIWALPFGIRVRMDADRRSLELLESAVTAGRLAD